MNSREQLKIQTLRRAQQAEKSGTLGAVKGDDKTEWKVLSTAVDSGACDNVMKLDELPAYEDRIIETVASMNQMDFVSATGDPIENFGEVRIPMVTREGTGRGMVFQAAAVAKPLASVQKMNEAGHIVVFDGAESFVYNKVSGEVNMLRQEDGNFMLDVWVPPPEVAIKAGFVGRP